MGLLLPSAHLPISELRRKRGGCLVNTNAGFCVIDGSCVEEGAKNPEAPCQVCNSASEPTAWSDALDDTPCASGDPCLTGESCTAGSCMNGAEADCDDSIACTVDSCEPGLGCQHLPDDGACPGDVCSVGACSVETGCWLSPDEAKEGTGCDDGNLCTFESTCSAGVCAGGSEPGCDDGYPCTTDGCNPASGECESVLDEGFCLYATGCAQEGELDPANPCMSCQPEVTTSAPSTVPDEQACDDDDLCSLTSRCIQGLCMQDTPNPCDDGLACTNDSCDAAAQACVNVLSEGSCLIDGLCHASGESVDAETPCRVCTPEVSTEAWSDADTSVPCDDGNLCTLNDTCGAGGVCGGPESQGSDVDCDDQLPCTSDSCNLIDGSCVNVLTEGCLIEGECHAESDSSAEDLCLQCVPSESTDSWSSGLGLSCGDLVIFGAPICGESGCEIVCEDGHADCDGDPSNGCEVNTSDSPTHCGGCDSACPGAIPWCVEGGCKPSCSDTQCGALCVDTNTHAEHCGGCESPCSASEPGLVGICAEGACADAPCPEGRWDLDGQPANGCEYACTISGVESCGGGDEDCDGLIDEGFDLTSDPSHCGGCGEACAHETVSTWSCVESTCYINDCGTGQEDADGLADNGCEAEGLVAGELWVDPWAEPGDADGSPTSPFLLIQDAIDAAEPGDVIYLLEGTHAGGVFSLKDNLSIRGAGKDKTFVITQSGESGFLNTGSGLTLRDMTFKGGAIGVDLAATPEAPMTDVAIVNVAIEDIVAAESEWNTPGNHAYGIRAFAVNALRLLDVGNEREGVKAATSTASVEATPTAYGSQHESASLINVSTSSMQAGAGGASDHMGNPGGMGGSGVGLYATNAQNLDIVSPSASGLRGQGAGLGAMVVKAEWPSGFTLSKGGRRHPHEHAERHPWASRW